MIIRLITGIIEQIDGLACRLEEKVRHHMGSVAHTRGGDPQGNRAAMAASGTSEFAFFAVVTEWPVACIHIAVEWSPPHARKGGWPSNRRMCFVG